MKIILKNPQKQMEKMRYGKLLMFIKHPVMMTMMKMIMIIVRIHIVVVFDHGKKIIQMKFFLSISSVHLMIERSILVNTNPNEKNVHLSPPKIN